jgi:uncharacterized protein YdaU (DUF1376 family)
MTAGYFVTIITDGLPRLATCGTAETFDTVAVIIFYRRALVSWDQGKSKVSTMAALPYMQFYPADYLADTIHLTLEEDGAYLRLLLNYWQRGFPPKDNDVHLARICRIGVSEWINIRPNIIEFFDIQEGRWYHKRVELELLHVEKKQKQRIDAGKASAKSRKFKENSTVVQRSFNKRSTNGSFNDKDIDIDTDTDKTKIKTNGRFAPPSIQEVTKYCDQRKSEGKPPVDPETFIDYYEAGGWMRNKTKIKCWKSCVRTWEKNPRRHETPKREIGAKRNERIRKELERSSREGTGDNRGYVPLLPSSEETGS